MENRKNQKTITNGITVTIIISLILFMFILFFGRNNEQSFVDLSLKEINETVKMDASTLFDHMNSISVATKINFSDETDLSDKGAVAEDLQKIIGNTAAYKAVVVGKDLKGIDEDGGDCDLSKEDYAGVLSDDSVRVFIGNVQEGVSDKPALIVKVPSLKGTDNVLVAYVLSDDVEAMLSTHDYYNTSFYAILDGENTTIYSSGDAPAYIEGDLMANVKKASFHKSSYPNLAQKMKEHTLLNVHIEKDGDSRYITYSQIGNTGWNLVVGISAAYMSDHVKPYLKATTALKIEVLVCLFALIITFVVTLLVIRAHNNEKSKELEGKADTDLLTGLTNKLSTEARIRDYIQENPEGQGVLIIIDVDNFKKINDTMGHSFGDEVLRSLGLRLKSLYRVTDVIGRIGGDEFLVFLKDIKDMAIIEREARKLDAFFKDFEVGEYVKYSVTASLGAAVYTMDGMTFEELYKNADSALYDAKHHGKNQLHFYKQDEKFPAVVDEE